jgi:hypothetical protein
MRELDYEPRRGRPSLARLLLRRVVLLLGLMLGFGLCYWFLILVLYYGGWID